MAAATFEGNATPETAEFYRARLVDALAASGLSCADEREFRINTFGSAMLSLARRPSKASSIVFPPSKYLVVSGCVGGYIAPSALPPSMYSTSVANPRSLFSYFVAAT